MNYKEKLKQFNSTEKYRKELFFLLGLIGGGEGKKILDYGCGIMTAIQYLSLKSNHFYYGFDVNKFADEDYEHLYDNDLHRTYDIIYLMHSIAHIKDIDKVLESLRQNLNPGGRIIAISPNREWMDAGYNEDKTVIKHFDIFTISELFVSAGYEVEQIGQFGAVKKDIYQHNRLTNERIFITAK